LGQGVLLFNVFFDAQICTFLTRGPQDPPTGALLGVEFAYPLAEGALSAVSNAQRLYQFPLGVLAVSLATTAFPLFSLYASRGDLPGLRSSVAQSLRLAIFVGLPSGVIMVVLAGPIVSLLFEHGRFGPDATVRAARVLQCYGVGMVAFCCQHILLRGFYSLKDTLTPMWIGCYLVMLNLALNLALIWHPAIREAAFGISTTITAILHVCISLLLLRRRMKGRIGTREVAAAAIRTAVIGTMAGVVAWGLLGWTRGLGLSSLGTTGARAVHVFVPLLGSLTVYLLLARLAGMPEISWLLARQRCGDERGAQTGAN
jgi:putative peptidoglycan lipid II flippase